MISTEGREREVNGARSGKRPIDWQETRKIACRLAKSAAPKRSPVKGSGEVPIALNNEVFAGREIGFR
jgi:hypothetical protein